MKILILLFCLPLICLGNPSSDSFPNALFKIKTPPAPSKSFEKFDLSQHNEEFLANTASRHADKGRFELAIQFQYWATQAKPEDGLYELACYYSLNNDTDAAVYYLQKAAISEGVYYSFALEDRQLIPVMNSKYWDKLRPWLKSCSDVWTKSSHCRILSIVPNEGRSKAILIGFHGYGSKPEDFASSDDQDFANKHQVTFIGISASIPFERDSFMWSENIAKDYTHIKRLLKTKGLDLNKEKRPVILIGFSQGAQLSTELLARHPKLFHGIITLCPGSKNGSQLNQIKTTPKLKGKKAIIICGADEHAGNLALSKANYTWLRNQGAQVRYSKINGMGHSFPPNYYQELENYLEFILE
ncbi:hypothetical protein PQO01_17770 [Lentisphaera marina]|uniref:hypothetical protein n=1 Tax=Lentisphaera marina TaxID=1111041 RepID=UPI002366A14E|nr:hypothetical protein [Lentisphaera marina]MDD7986802.1 hypothetical protein [Lentisphaera marina]